MPFLATLPVDVTATSAEWGVSKPDAAFFERVCHVLEVDPASVAYVGDRIDNDVQPAKAAGMIAVHLRRGPWGVLHDELPEAAEADLRVSSLSQLADGLSMLGFRPDRSGRRSLPQVQA